MSKHHFVHAKMPHFAHRSEVSISLIFRMKELFHFWRQNWQTRRQLAMLTGEELRDVGMTESQRMEELNKFFWEP